MSVANCALSWRLGTGKSPGLASLSPLAPIPRHAPTVRAACTRLLKSRPAPAGWGRVGPTDTDRGQDSDQAVLESGRRSRAVLHQVPRTAVGYSRLGFSLRRKESDTRAGALPVAVRFKHYGRPRKNDTRSRILTKLDPTLRSVRSPRAGSRTHRARGGSSETFSRRNSLFRTRTEQYVQAHDAVLPILGREIAVEVWGVSLLADSRGSRRSNAGEVFPLAVWPFRDLGRDLGKASAATRQSTRSSLRGGSDWQRSRGMPWSKST